ncbi:hypothetical protein DT075_33595 [Bacillus licheniformis]|nr:hypothetical protein DT075_33595 [Bacillus licheniformis]
MKTLKKKLTEHISVKIMIGVALVLLITIASFSAVFTFISKDLSEQLKQQFQNRLYKARNKKGQDVFWRYEKTLACEVL